ncbi:MAG: beta-propeller fold lactonase family protein [Buchnera aphidicola (Periphyllus lyropictus)]|uniref:beta-propeller fold lactonase family protein n=1 Tax=Buchnera aphidicola TaxID=9 RepID=UPI001ED17D39|nr:beta-propeller fold lactonase family protein [Buchnera aphidicola]NIH16604.1 beta-propeller fold lactonase family protein [Buchnera aphidicola (Periphyllus lyropictus)]USS94517.1 beta-propeller fold lactonase family protein [Buchnera aphidicola (Periphyllus lyropictus)]
MKKKIIYVSIPKKNIIQVFKFNKKKIKKIQEIFTNGEVQPIKLYKKKNILYAGVRNSSRIIIYKINSKGLLKFIKEVYTIGSPNHLSIDKKKKYLFNSSYGENCITCHKLLNNGILKKTYKTKNNILGCHSSISELKSKILFFTSLKKDKIFICKIKKIKSSFHKKIKYLKSEKNSGPRHLEIHPNNKFLYVINELNANILVWKINKKIHKIKKNYIQKIDIVPNFFGKKWAADIHIHPSGNFLYSCERTTSKITLFYVNSKNGTLKFIKTYNTEKQPRSFKLDKEGKFLIISGQKSNSISIYKINNTNGFLKKINQFKTLEEPLWIEILTLN